jgi:hypothetical protein
MVQAVAAIAMGLPGLDHLIGFVVPWRVATIQGYPYRTTTLNGAVGIGDLGARLLGLVWLVLASGSWSPPTGSGAASLGPSRWQAVWRSFR